MYEIKKGNLRFFSRHQALNQDAYNMASMITAPKVLNLKINIYVGIHKFRKKYLKKSGYHLGVQTEQLYDEFGNQMWRKQRKYRLLRDLMIYDRILDFSDHNKLSYQWLLKRFQSKIDFGPYIFPKKTIDISPFSKEKYIFYGSLNAHRNEIIEKIGHNLIKIVKTDTYGKELSEKIFDHKAVLNIHYKEGIYTEWPRVLSAYLHGKVVVSEKLSSILEPGTDYILINDILKKNNYEKIFNNFNNKIIKNYAIEDYLFSKFGNI